MSSHTVKNPQKKGSKTAKNKHVFSPVLKTDSRLESAPRHVEVVHESQAPSACIFIVKVYAPVAGTKGSELLTVSCARSAKGLEFEMRFDERYPISLRFRTQNDEERVAHARTQIQAAGGFEKLAAVFESVFPEFGV